MIESSDEMVEAARSAYRTSWAPDAAGQMREVVAAVLAIVARDHCLERRGHVYHPLRREIDRA